MTQTPAGWFPDPQLPGQLRYWNGAAWTARTQPAAHIHPGNAELVKPSARGATTSFVLGILSLFACGLFTGIPAMVIGRRAIRDVDDSEGRLGGRGLAQAGFWTGLAGVALSLFGLVLVTLVLLYGDAIFDCTRQPDGSVRCE